MYDSKTTKLVKTRKKCIYCFIATFFCTLVIVSSIGAVNNVGNTTFPANTTFNDNFDFQRDYFNQFGRFIPYDFINQVIPVVFKLTGQETLDVVTLPPGKFCDTSCKLQPNTSTPFSTQYS